MPCVSPLEKLAGGNVMDTRAAGLQLPLELMTVEAAQFLLAIRRAVHKIKFAAGAVADGPILHLLGSLLESFGVGPFGLPKCSSICFVYIGALVVDELSDGL